MGLPGKPIEIDFERIAYKELQVSGGIGQRRPAWKRALRLMENGRIPSEKLITHHLRLSDWQDAFLWRNGRRALSSCSCQRKGSKSGRCIHRISRFLLCGRVVNATSSRRRPRLRNQHQRPLRRPPHWSEEPGRPPDLLPPAVLGHLCIPLLRAYARLVAALPLCS